MKIGQVCSRCGSSERLNLITLMHSPPEIAGRTLLYCADCRKELSNRIGVSIPIDDLTPEAFLELYRDGKTESEPSTAVMIVFGEENQPLVEAAKKLLSDKD